MADIELARAYVELIPVAKGMSKRAQEEIFPGDKVATESADRAGKTFGNRLGSVLKKSAIGVGVAAGGLLATSLVKGFGRLSAIETAEAKLKGLGNSATDVAAIMDNALGAVKGTAFGMDEAATTAASAVAAGIKPGQELESYLRLVGDAATIAGTDMSSMGSIFNKVATSGKIQGDVFAQLGDKGIPIVTLLAEQLGVTAGEVYKMGAAGTIGTEDFLTAMSSMSGAALEGGNTTAGAFKNMGAALGRLGAELLAGIYPMIGPVFTAITGVLDQATTAVRPFIEKITPGITAAATAAIGLVTTLVDSAGGIAEVFRSGDFDPSKWGEGISEDSPLVSVAFAIRDAWVRVRDVMTPVLGAVRDGIESAIPYVRDLWSWFSQLSTGAQALFGGAAIAGGLAMFGKLGSTIGLLTGKVKTLLGPIGRFAPLLRLALGPVGLIVAGLATLIATNDDVRSSFGDLLEVLGTVIGDTMATLGPIVADLAAQLGPLLGAAAVAVAGALQALAPAVVWVIDGIAKLLTWLQPAMPLLIGIAGAVFAVVKVVGVVVPIVLKVWAVLSKVIAVVKGLGIAFTALTGPIGWIVLGVVAAGAALWAFFTKTEKGRELWAKIWGGIKSAVDAVVSWFRDTAWPVLQAAWDGIAAGVMWLYHNAILPAWNGIRSAIAAVGDWITGTLWPALQAAWQGIATAALWLYHNVITPVWTGIKTAIAVAVALILTYIDLLKWYFSNVIAPVAMWLWRNVITPAWNGIQAAIGAVVAWVRDVAWPAIKAAWDAIAGAAMWLWNSVLRPAWAGIQAAIGAVVSWLTGTAWPFIKRVWDQIAAAATWLYRNVLVPVWAGIQAAIAAVVSWLQNRAWPAIQTVIGWLKMSFEGWKLLAQTVWAAIRTAVDAVVAWFRDTAWPAVSNVIERLKTGFSTMRDRLGEVWSAIRDRVIEPVVSWFRDTVKPLFDRVTDGIGDAFVTMKDAVAGAFEKLRDAAKAPVRFVVETVVNDALIANFNKVARKLKIDTLPDVKLPAGFWGGGILPGMSRMSDGDDQLVPMRRGEGVLVSEGLRTPRDRAAFLAANEAGKRGIGFASLLTGGFAGGGILGDVWRGAKGLAGDALDKVLEGVDFVAEAIMDPKGMFGKVFDAVIGQVPGAGLMVDMAKGAGSKLLDGLTDALLGSFGGGDVEVGPMPPGASRSLSYARQVAAAHGLTMTSFHRPGARTAGSGMVSLHAQRRAMDFSNSSGPTPQMMAFFNAMHRLKPTELLYSPAGHRQWRRSGRMADTSGATKRGHFNHVHVGFNKGGIYDQGGWLPPGGIGVNLSNRPEPVFTGAQWDMISEGLTEQRNRPGLGNVIVQVEHRDGEDPSTFGRRIGEALELDLLSLDMEGV